mgnify:CR=1 FL=1
MATFKSPTGAKVVGTKELLVGICRIVDIDANGHPIHGDHGTEVLWDTIETARQGGKLIYLDENGAEWTFDQLTRDR